jgi:hypothetical protein
MGDGTMTVAEIIMEYLKANGYDGLCNDECGCELSNLFPCCEAFDACEPGYKIQTSKDNYLYGEYETIISKKNNRGGRW